MKTEIIITNLCEQQIHFLKKNNCVILSIRKKDLHIKFVNFGHRHRQAIY